MGEDARATIYLVDDDQSVLKGLARLLRASGYETRSFPSPVEFLAAHDPQLPGCAILDLMMGDIDGLDLQSRLEAAAISRPIIFLSGAGDISSSVQAMKAGAIDFLTKPVDPAQLLAAVERALVIDRRSRSVHAEVESINAKLAALTPRERQVLEHVVAGRLNKQIAASLGTVEKTIKVHRMRMMHKMGVSCVADLVRLSGRAGVAPIPRGAIGP
jgi:FixJ family two-component response regulator